MLFGLKVYWSPIDAVCAALIASFGAYLIYLAHPELSLLAYPIGWVIVAALIYQTGSELTARRKRR